MRGPIYLAGRYSRIDELNTYRQALEAEGLSVRARWLDGEHQARSRDLEASDPGSARAVDDPDGLGRAIPDEALGFAQDDLHDVLLARTIVSFTEAPRSTNSRGGRHVELGIGIGRRGLLDQARTLLRVLAEALHRRAPRERVPYPRRRGVLDVRGAPRRSPRRHGMSLRDDLHALADEIADQAESRLGSAVSSRMHPDGMADDSTVAELRDFLSSDRPIEGPDEIDAILCALNEVVGYYAEGVAFPDRPADGWCTRPDADHPTGDSWRHDGLTIRWIVNATLERLARQGLGDGQESSDPRWASDDGRRVLTVFEAGRKAAEGNPALRGAGDQAGARLLDELRHRGIEHRELFPLVAGIDLLAGLLRAEGPMSPVGATLDRAITAFAVGLGDVILEEAGR